MPNNQRNTNVRTRSASQNHILDIQSDNSHKHNPKSVTTLPRPTHPGQPKDVLLTPTPSPPSSPDQLSSPSSPPTPLPTTQPPQSARSHKVVNHTSTNQRQCKRASDNLSRSTPDQNNLSQRKHAHSTRMTLKLNCPISNNSEETIIKLFREFLGELNSADSTVAILPWKLIHRSQGSINKPLEVPTNARDLRVYMNKFFLSRTLDKQFLTYPGIHIGHDKSLSDLREEMQPWLQEGGHGLFYKMLQVEDSTEIGWFLYSTKEMDAGALVDEIEDLMGLQVGLRWKIIDVGAKGKLPESQRVRALNVEVNTRSRWEAQRKLIEYFGKNAKNPKAYPNGIRLQFVKNKKDGINAAEKGKIERLQSRQKSFLDNILTTVTWDIIQLDYSPDRSQPTLRQMIMDLKTDNDIPLFHCVDLDWRGEGYIFQFAPAVKVEAECTVNTLLPLLKHHYPNADLAKYFSHEAIDRCEGYKYNVNKGAVVDDLVDTHLSFIDDENLLGFSFTTDAATDGDVQTEEVTRPSETVLYNDSDSVSTLAKPGAASFLTPSFNNNVSFSRSDTRSNDSMSITSNTSAITMETISTMEKSISALTTHVQKNDQKFDEIMSYLRSTHRGPASSAINQDCAPVNSTLAAGEDLSVSGHVQ
jgi:hypothetical protein